MAVAGLDSLIRMPPRTAEVIAVGSELLGATRTDTNSLYLSGRLSERFVFYEENLSLLQ